MSNEKIRYEPIPSSGRKRAVFLYDGVDGDELPLPPLGEGKSAEAARYMLSAAQHGYSLTTSEVAYAVDTTRAIANNALQTLKRYGWVTSDELAYPGTMDRSRRFTIIGYGDVTVDTFRLLDDEFTLVDVPEDWHPRVTDTRRRQASAAARAKGGKGWTPPPFGVPIQITKAELVTDGIELTLDRKWTGVMEKKALLAVGDHVEVIGAGVAEDGPWINTTQFTLRKVK